MYFVDVFRHKKKRKGQALVEFAFAFLIFITMIIGIVQLFLILQNKSAVEAAAQYALRKAAITDLQQGPACTEATEAARKAFVEFMSNVANGFDPATFNINAVKAQCPDTPVRVGNLYMFPLIVHVEYPMKLILPVGVSTITLETTLPGAFERLLRVEERG